MSNAKLHARNHQGAQKHRHGSSDQSSGVKSEAKVLEGKRVAILATDGFEQAELTEPRRALDGAGAQTIVIAPHAGSIRGWQQKEWGDEVKVDLTIDRANPDDYDALLLPGGVMNPDSLRTDKSAVELVRSFFEADKPVAAICHGPVLLIEADVLHERHVTSWPSLKTDVANAGGQWSDQEWSWITSSLRAASPRTFPPSTRR